MKTLLPKNFTKFVLTIGLASMTLVGCKKEETIEEAKPQAKTSLAEQNARIEADSKLLADALQGGLENVSSNEKGGKAQLGNLDTRILINGSIVGYNVAGYQQPYVSTSGNLIAHIAELLKRYEYTVSFANNVLTATRSTQNTFGARSIKVTNGSATVSYTTSGGTNTSVALPEPATIIGGSVFAPARVIAVLAGAAIAEWDADTKSLQTYYYEVNDYGIYFYGSQGNTLSLIHI